MINNFGGNNEARRTYEAMRVSKLGKLVDLTQQMADGDYYDVSPVSNPMFRRTGPGGGA